MLEILACCLFEYVASITHLHECNKLEDTSGKKITTINNPLVNSPYEIPERKDVHLLIKNEVLLTFFYRQVTKRNFFNGLYLLFQSYLQANSTITLHKKLGERLNAFPQARCKLISECISLLTPGSNYVYLDVWQNEEKQ